MNKSLILIVLVIGLAFVLGFGLGYWLGASGEDSKLQSQIGELQSQIEKAKQFFPSTPDLFSISGTVKEVKSDSVVIEAFPSSNPFEELPLMREVVVTEETVIVKQEPKDPKVFQAEQEEYQEALQEAQQAVGGPGAPPAAANLPPPPNFFEEVELAIEDLAVGDQVSVEAGRNIKTETRFEAVRIVLQAGPAGVPAPAPTQPAP